MASGRTHDIVNLVVFPPVVYYLQPVEFVSFTAGYLAGTFFLSPDNDIYHSSQNRRWKFLRFIWYPYTRMFRHRGISHLPFYGAATKLMYLSVIFTIILVSIDFLLETTTGEDFLRLDLGRDFVYFFTEPDVLSFISGLLLSEIVHIFTDMVYSIVKPKKRKRRR